jgi:hypothetical protein
MHSINPVVTGRGLGVEPLAVRPNRAMVMLDCGRTYLYELINAGALESYTDGKARKITVKSIKRYIARKLNNSKQVAA